MKIQTITFTNIQEQVSPLHILAQNMLEMQHQISSILGANKKYVEAREFLSKSNPIIAAVVKVKDEESLAQLRSEFIQLCDKYRGEPI